MDGSECSRKEPGGNPEIQLVVTAILRKGAKFVYESQSPCQRKQGVAAEIEFFIKADEKKKYSPESGEFYQARAVKHDVAEVEDMGFTHRDEQGSNGDQSPNRAHP